MIFFGGAALGLTGRFVKKEAVGGTIGIDMPSKVQQTHKDNIKQHSKGLPAANADQVLKTAKMAADAEAEAFLKGQIKTNMLRYLNAQLTSYGHDSEFTVGVAEIAAKTGAIDAKTVKSLARTGIQLEQDRVEVNAYQQRFDQNRSFFGSLLGG